MRIKPTWLAFTAVCFYGAGNVIVDYKLKTYALPVIIATMSLYMFLVSLSWIALIKINGEVIITPEKWYHWLWIIGYGTAVFLGDYFYLSAYSKGGDMFSITTMAITLPIFVALFTGLIERSYPNFYQLGGYFGVVASILLITRGGK